ncbi:MAG TPA: S41 family peptidase [Ferruginibacter sp.]|nr:S41 family peptidase [Ferruginibacter sp.]
MVRFFSFFIVIAFFLSSCNTICKSYDPNKRYTRQQLQQDYTLLRNILEKKHPSLYWYTSKDSMDYYFDTYYQNIEDSMTEQQFGWKILAPLTNKIHCGHTSFIMSDCWNRFIVNRTVPSFPLYMKIWDDTMVVIKNLNTKDSILKYGTLITSINDLTNKEMIGQMFDYLPVDGYAENVNYIRLSSNFPYFYRNVYGIYKNYRVGYIDTAGMEKTTLVPLYNLSTDSIQKEKQIKISRKKMRKQYINGFRSFTIDTSINTAILTLNTFSKGGGRHLGKFIRRSFKTIKKDNLNNLILDLRINGGGDVDMFILLTKYLRNTRFKVVDSTYAIAQSLKPYGKYIKHAWVNNIGLFFLTKKDSGGRYEYGYYKRHFYHPKTTNHFNGNLYVLVSGTTFSASTLFCNAVKGQSNVKLIGEETGGGWYGNNGIMIPEIILPNTKLRVRLPLFRMVQYNHTIKDGRGVAPDIVITPTLDNVRKGIDRKMVFTKDLIRQSMPK